MGGVAKSAFGITKGEHIFFPTLPEKMSTFFRNTINDQLNKCKIKFSIINTRAVDEKAINNIFCPSKPKTTAKTTPETADTTDDVELKTSGITIDVITAKGI